MIGRFAQKNLMGEIAENFQNLFLDTIYAFSVNDNCRK